MSTSCKAISICNLFPYESISLPDSKGQVLKSREPLHPEVSLQCTKIHETYKQNSQTSNNGKKNDLFYILLVLRMKLSQL